VCQWLGTAYLQHRLVEPIDGRGRHLVERACKIYVDSRGFSDKVYAIRELARCIEQSR
jgi:hypothetical protein